MCSQDLMASERAARIGDTNGQIVEDSRPGGHQLTARERDDAIKICFIREPVAAFFPDVIARIPGCSRFTGLRQIYGRMRTFGPAV